MKKAKWIWAALVIVLAVGLLTACVGKTPCQKQGHQWQAADCEHPKTCTVCGEAEGEALGHAWSQADCEHPQTCTVCGKTGEPALGHQWCPATCTEPATCTVCGATEGEPLGHDLLRADCTNPIRCGRCGHTQGEALGHAWLSATCTEPEICGVCGQEQGEPVGHQWAEATCDEPCVCTVCGQTEGEALEHEWQKATCAAPRTCKHCGQTSGFALGHDLAASTDGKTKTCNTCGETVQIKYVAITFDDGPSGGITKKLLEGLQNRGAKATFFLCGYRIKSYPSYPQMIIDGGHEIGLHTYNHKNLKKLDADGARAELEKMLPMLPEGYNVRLMRPPEGAYDATVKQVCQELSLSIIMWSVDPRDWATSNVDTIVERIVNGVSNGSIILMHDLKNSSVTAALKAIDILRARGYEFVTVSELAEIQGRTLEGGKVYSSLKP